MQAKPTLHPNSAARTKSSWLASNKPLAWVCMPILVFMFVMIGIVIFEAAEERRFQARVQQLRSLGTPVDHASLITWTHARTRSEGVIAWSEIDVMQRMLSQVRLKSPSGYGTPADTDNALHRVLFLGKDVSDDERINDYLEKARPLFRAVKHVLELPKPIMMLDRLGIGFEGVRSELRLELMHALQHRQVERATNAMELIFRIWDACKSDKESQESLGNESYWGRRNEYVAITRSLCADLWDEAFVRKLMVRLEEDDSLESRCRSMVIRYRALGLDEIPRFVEEHEAQVRRSDGALTGFRFFPIPRNFMTGSAKNRLLDACEAFEQLAPLDYHQLGVRTEEVEKQYFETDRRLFFFQVPYEFRHLRSGIGIFIDTENHRRMARTALAVKLFKLKNGEWPTSLGDLSKVDFPASESITVQGERFGYEVDGDSAFVWRFRTLNPETLFAETREYGIATHLRSIRSALEEIDSAELVRIR